MPPKRKRSDKQVAEDDNAKRQKPPPHATPVKSAVIDHEPAPSGSASTERKFHVLFDHVTDDVVQSWDEKGRQDIVVWASQADEIILSEILQELVESCLCGRLSGRQSGDAIQRVIAARRDVDDLEVASQLLDIISLLDDEHQKNSVLRQLVAATAIDPVFFRQELDIPLLQALNLVRDTFEKMRTRKSTNILYKQANFNLLREESEGYAKLVTDYFNTVQEACGPQRHALPHIAEDAFQRVMALVGAFDLDVGRVLDITLDVSANLLVKAYPFLVKFYRSSSWWPDEDLPENIKVEDQGFSALPIWALPGSGRSSTTQDEDARLASLKETRDQLFWDAAATKGTNAFFELGARRIANFDSVLSTLETEIPIEVDSRGRESNPEKRQYLTERRNFMRETRTLPPPGNYDAAQLLGFKLRFYASPARNATDVLPDNLIKLAAFLIKIGFISLRDLYPHLHPADEDMPQEKKRLEKEKAAREAKDRPGGGMNALALAAALPDDAPAPRVTRVEKEKSGAGTPAQDKKEEPEAQLPPPENQKIQLLKALLLIGALPEAMHIIGRFPWLVEAESSLVPLLHRIANHMVSKISGSLKPLPRTDGLKDSEDQLADTSAPDGKLALTSRPTPRPMRWLHNDTHNADDGVMYIHYYVDWNDNIPICQTVDDVFCLCNTFLGLLGFKIGQDVKLYGTLLRLAKESLANDRSEANRARWLELMKRLLVPALSTSNHNPEIAQEVFDLLLLWPASVRYSIYAEWFVGRTSRTLDIRNAFDRNKAEVRDVLRRVSNDVGKKQSRALAKVAISSPGVVVMEMINQLESYSNMIPSLVECTRYFSPLASDVLTWCLINSVSGQGRDRQQADGMLTSSWLQALSTFVATLYTKYSNLDPTPVLQYLAYELRSGNATDLEMIEQILVEMAGIRSDVEFNDQQILAMGGGQHLQNHIMRQLSDTRHVKDKSAKRLIKALSGPNLTGQILISIAQERQMYPEHESASGMPLKVLGSNLDKVSAIFVQYLEVLKANLKPEQFAIAIPDVTSLVEDFGIEPGIALTICRTVIRHRMSESDAIKKEELKEKETKAKVDQAKPDANGDTKMDEISTSNSVSTEIVSKDGDDALASSHWHPVLEPLIQSLTDILPELASTVSIPFYVTFWTLMQSDVFVPTEAYKREMQRIDVLMKELNANRNGLSAIELKERDKKRKILQETRDKLADETKPHMNAYIRMRGRISGRENLHWFSKTEAENIKDDHAQKEARHTGLLQECFLPRAMLSAVDAHYSWTLLKIMHDNGTPGFSLMHLLTHLFKKQELASLMFQCTAVEAQNFGRFLNEILKHLLRWHGDKETYTKEALGLKKKLPGFAKNFDANGEPKQTMDWEEFRRMLFNFHTYLFGALSACFESSEYMHIRNAIIVLRAMCTVFPILTFQGKKLIEIIKNFSDNDSRQDLKLAAMSLLGPLKGGEKNWQQVTKFRTNDPAKDAAKPGVRSTSARPETPQAMRDTPKLNASAAEFKSGVNGRVTNGGRKESTTVAAEDGEIEDIKTDIAKKGDVVMNDAPNIVVQAASVVKDDVKVVRNATNTATISSDKTTAAQDSPRTEPKSASIATPNNRPTPRANGAQSRVEIFDSSATPTGPQSRPSPNSHARSEQDLIHNLPGASSLPRANSRYSARGDEGYGRLERPSDSQTVSRDHSPATHGGQLQTSSTSNRHSYRDERNHDRPSYESRANRDDRSTRREPLKEDRSIPGARDRPEITNPQAGSQPHPDRMKHISSVVLTSDNQPSTRPVSSASGAPNTPVGNQHVNPARLAMINADNSSGTSPRRTRDAVDQEQDHHRDRDARYDERGAIGQPSFPARSESRPNGRNQVEPMREQASRPDTFGDSTPSVLKPRGSRSSRDFSAESTYGRLNAPHDVPSGPRQANGSGMRTGRNFTAPAGHPHMNEEQSQAANVPRRPEQSTGSRVASRQSSISHFERQSAPLSAGANANDLPPSVHPSRAQFVQPAPIQTNLAAPNGPRGTSSPTTTVPSGPRITPRGPASATPTGPSPLSGVPPSGPARRSDRPPRTAIDTTNVPATSSPSSQGVNFRGASTRQAHASSFSPATSRPNLSATPSTMDPPYHRRTAHEGRPSLEELPTNQSNGRDDLFANKPLNWQDGPNISGRHGDDDGREHRGARHGARDGSPRGGRRGPENSSRPGPPPLTAPPPLPEWERHNLAASGGMEGGRRGTLSSRMSGNREDFRGPTHGTSAGPPMRRDEDRNLRGPPRDDGLQLSDSRKRGPPPHDGTLGHPKRRRSER